MTQAMQAEEDLSARELERKISDLKRDRVRLEDTVRRMEANQHRIFREDDGARNRIQAAQDEGAAEPSEKEKENDKQRRSRSGSRSDAESKKSDKGEDGDAEDKNGKAEKAEEAVEGKDDERKKKRPNGDDSRPKKSDPRSRNLFGKLLGHLHSAKNRLESEKGSRAAELHAKAQERIHEKLSLSKMNIKEFRKTQFEERMKEEAAKVTQIEKSIEAMELLLLQKRLEEHYSLMMNYIRTKAEPTIFYLPAKHTKGTERALEETRAAIKHKIASLKVQLQRDDAQVAEETLRASAAAAAVAVVEAPSKVEDKAEDPKEEEDKGGDSGGNADEKGTPAKDKPESDKKQAASDDEEDHEEKEAAEDKRADSDASSSKKRKAGADDGDGKSKRRKEDGSASESGR